jgi:hypothetical protein
MCLTLFKIWRKNNLESDIKYRDKLIDEIAKREKEQL